MLKIRNSSEVPWKVVFHKANWYKIYEDGDRFILVPRERHIGGILSAFEGACKLASIPGELGVDGFEIRHRIGNIAQEIDWPYIEMIKVRNGDGR
jgi:hypothetical protein